ncbi:MAG: alpha/beta hydrolase [Candidatus Woesearchaeota archaeon]
MKFHKIEGNKTLYVVFHGTGGNEFDLIPLTQEIDTSASILSLRGEVEEQGMLRFFRRTAMNVFDIKNVKEEGEKIYNFLQDKIKEYERVIFLGYSNGANMIGALIQLYPHFISHAVLLHPMKVLDTKLSTKANIIITLGEGDTMIPAAETRKFISYLKESGATVHELIYQGGHGITHDEIIDVRKTIQKEFY